jgi:predicted membrane chloride channel (bestrophin family)
MVSSDPIFHGTWTAKKFQATVLHDIWPETLFFTLFATMVTCVHQLTSTTLSFSNELLTVLGLVLGLVISFRTSSAYERYQDGRKMWSNVITTSRNLAQQFWLHIPEDRTGKGDLTKTVLENTIEKKSMVNLILAFAVSTKHFLRDEPGVYYEDLYPLLSFLPRYANGIPNEDDKLALWHDDKWQHHHNIHTPVTELARETSSESTTTGVNMVDAEKGLPRVSSDRPLLPGRNPPVVSLLDYIPLLRLFRWIGRKITGAARPRGRGKNRVLYEYVESNVPLEIILVLSNYSSWIIRNGLISPAAASGVITNITSLQDTLSNLERICNTPLPFAYQVHLRMTLWLYLIFLPFQVVEAFNWITIPGTAFTAFFLLGFLEIGAQIENPFNYDLNDLDLDYFCFAIQRELHLITAYPCPSPSDFIFNEINQPLAPADYRSAKELVKSGDYSIQGGVNNVEPGVPSMRRSLLNGWRHVEQLTHYKEGRA